MPIPQLVARDIAHLLRQIGARFKNPTITLIVRSPDLEDGDLVMTDDDPREAIAAMERLIARGNPVQT